MKKQIFLKLTIFFISTVLSVGLVEVGVRYYLYRVNQTRVYHDIKEFNKYEHEERGEDDYFRDRTFEVYDTQSNTEILCFGDSFTNAGNTFSDYSYPYQLYKLLGGKITVRNMGVCSSTTSQVYERFDNFIKSEEFNKKKNYIAIFLVGSADFFTRNLSGEKVIDLEKYQKWKKLTNTPENSFLSSLYFFKMTKILFSSASRKINLIDLDTFDSIGFNEDLILCKKSKSQVEKINCYVSLLGDGKFKKLDNGIKEHLVIRQIFNQQMVFSADVTNVLKDFILLIQKQPSFAERDYLIMNLVGLIELQSQLGYQDLKNVLSSIKISKEANDFNQRVLNNVLDWSAKGRSLNSIRDIEWDKINDLAKKNNIKIIIMNYPLAYFKTNSYLENMSKSKKIDFVNLENLFSDKKNQIDDWEHCSPEGYGTIAKALKEKVQNLIVK